MSTTEHPGSVPDKQNLDALFAGITEHWKPIVAASPNGQHVRLAKLKGAFDWHHHADEDELFLVNRGTLTIEFRDGAGGVQPVCLAPGEFLVVPRGVEHRPVADEEVECLIFEPAGTLNTGNLRNERTVDLSG